MKTYSPKPGHIERRWYVMDASGQVLGRLASEVATLLRGKHKPMFAPHMDTGDHVIVINADKIELTGNKAEQKVAWRHSGYPGGIKGTPYTRMLAERPVAAVEKAVRGMLPKNSLGRQMIKKLHVVAGPEHPHAAQKPVVLSVGQRPAWDGLPAARVPASKAPAKRSDAAKPPAKAPASKAAAGSKTAAKPKAPAKTEKAKAPAKTEKAKAPAKTEKAKAPAKTEKAKAPAKTEKAKAPAQAKKKPASEKKSEE
jgi:large subunit ribosomal protein L13